MNPIKTLQRCYSNIYFNIIIPSTSMSSLMVSSLWYSQPTCAQFSTPPCALHAPPTSSSLIDDLNIWWRVQIMELLIMLFSPASCHFIPLN
jgi:hypothetical protein